MNEYNYDNPNNGEAMTKSSNEVSADRLKSFVKRIEHVEEALSASAEDRKEIYSEAKSSGFQVSIIRKIVALRKKEVEKRREEQEILDLYMSALGLEV